jgi:integrase
MIRKNNLANGSATYTAQVRFKRAGKTIFQETQTFERERVAKAWLARRRHELEQPGALEKKLAPGGTLAEAIDAYTQDTDRIGKTKAQVLKALKSYEIASKPMSEIQSHDVVELARQLGDGRKPQTVQNYLSHLGAIFAVARSAYGYDVGRDVVRDALESTRRLGMTRKSGKRDRRPTIDEMDRLMEHFADVQRKRPSSNPMHVICAFALFSTRRQEEIIRITWSDLDEPHSRVIVRDMKNPGQKVGNDVIVDLPPEALAIIRTMPRIDARIFPFSTDAISAAFTRACAFLEIEDLHFHDLRHEGVSRLFEMGWTIPQVSGVSGHRSWSSLQRYSHLRQTGDKWAGWGWIKHLNAPR